MGGGAGPQRLSGLSAAGGGAYSGWRRVVSALSKDQAIAQAEGRPFDRAGRHLDDRERAERAADA